MHRRLTQPFNQSHCCTTCLYTFVRLFRDVNEAKSVRGRGHKVEAEAKCYEAEAECYEAKAEARVD